MADQDKTKVFKVLISYDDSNELVLCDAIEFEGKKWLVPHWLVSPAEGWKTPTRIICMDNLPHQTMGGDWEADFALNRPLPRAVVDGRVPSKLKTQYVVIERPDVKIPGGDKLN